MKLIFKTIKLKKLSYKVRMNIKINNKRIKTPYNKITNRIKTSSKRMKIKIINKNPPTK